MDQALVSAAADPFQANVAADLVHGAAGALVRFTRPE
jgi:hypothetical protein